MLGKSIISESFDSAGLSTATQEQKDYNESWSVARNGSNHATADSCFTAGCAAAVRPSRLTSAPQAF